MSASEPVSIIKFPFLSFRTPSITINLSTNLKGILVVNSLIFSALEKYKGISGKSLSSSEFATEI